MVHAGAWYTRTHTCTHAHAHAGGADPALVAQSVHGRQRRRAHAGHPLVRRWVERGGMWVQGAARGAVARSVLNRGNSACTHRQRPCPCQAAASCPRAPSLLTSPPLLCPLLSPPRRRAALWCWTLLWRQWGTPAGARGLAPSRCPGARMWRVWQCATTPSPVCPLRGGTLSRRAPPALPAHPLLLFPVVTAPQVGVVSYRRGGACGDARVVSMFTNVSLFR